MKVSKIDRSAKIAESLTNKQYWLIFAGINMAGEGAENNCDIIYGTFYEAENAAKDQALEVAYSNEGMHGFPIFTDEDVESDEDDEEERLPWGEIWNYIEYYVEPVTIKQLQNHGLEDNFITMVKQDGFDLGTICKQLGLPLVKKNKEK